MLPLKVSLNANTTMRISTYNVFYLQNDMVTCMFFEYNINK